MENSGTAEVVHRILVLSILQEMGEAFIQDVVGKPSGPTGVWANGGQQVQLEVLAGDPRLNPAWDEAVNSADGMVMLARFMDVISLDKIKAIYRRLPSDKNVPFAVFLMREPQEADFKMSCPACGQKLWVRDSDVNKRGRCPNCKKAFKLPTQPSLIRSQLMLPDSVTVATLMRGEADKIREALGHLTASLSGDLLVSIDGSVDPDIVKKTTVRVQIQPEDL